MAAGAFVSFATGRIPGPWTEALRAQLPGIGPAVFGNGTLVVSKDGSLLHEALLPPKVVEIVEALFRGGRARTGGRVALLASTRWPDEDSGSVHYLELAPHGETWVTALLRGTGEPSVIREDFGDVATRKVHKLVIFSDPEDADWAPLAPDIVEMLRVELAGSDACVVDCGPRLCEVLPPGVDKASGVRLLLEAAGGIPSEAVLACGDAENDLEMLRMVGTGAAMGNARLAVKDAADVVVATNDEDGVAEAVRQFVLQKPPEA